MASVKRYSTHPMFFPSYLYSWAFFQPCIHLNSKSSTVPWQSAVWVTNIGFCAAILVLFRRLPYLGAQAASYWWCSGPACWPSFCLQPPEDVMSISQESGGPGINHSGLGRHARAGGGAGWLMGSTPKKKQKKIKQKHQQFCLGGGG